MSDLSTLISGTSVDLGDLCLTTLWFLGACASQDTDPRRSWDPAYVAPTLLVVNDARGLVGTDIFASILYSAKSEPFAWLNTPRLGIV